MAAPALKTNGRLPASRVQERSRLVPVAPPLGSSARARVLTANAELGREYVAAGGWGWVSEYAHTLPQYIDARTRDFGLDLYSERMRLDAQVESALSTFIMAILAQGISLRPGVEKGQPGDVQAQEISDFCKGCLDHLDRPVTDVFYEMGLGVAQGFKVAEQVYALEDAWGPSDEPRLVLKSLKTKPQHATAFVVDAFNNVLGLVYTRPGRPLPALTSVSSPLLGNSEDLVIPRSKFWVFSWTPENSDPRGRSILAAAYHPWWVKGQVWKAYLQYLATFAQPSIIGYVSANAQAPYLLDANGDPLPASTPQQIMANALEKIQNGAVGAFANDEKVEVLKAQGEGTVFVNAFNIANREITKAIVRQTLTTDEAAHMARAASEVHQDVFGLLVRFGKRTLIGSFVRDVIKPLVLYNYGPEAARDLLPICSLGETEHQDFATDATAIAALLREQFFDKSQYPALDEFLDLPLRDPLSWKATLEREQALADATVEAASQPPPSAAGSARASKGSAPARPRTPKAGTAGPD